MSEPMISRANILSEALPYIRQFHGKTFVVKYGGAAMVDEKLRKTVISDIVLLSLVGIKVIVVHGGGPEIDAMLTKIGKQPVFIDGQRVTDDETMDIVQMVLCGKVGKQLAQLIGEQGGKALGFSGLDGRMLVARKRMGKQDLKWVGDIAAVDPTPVKMALKENYIPVVSTVACGENNNEVFNINADIAAAELAAALQAEKLILLTDVRGVLRDYKDETSLIPAIALSEVDKLESEGIISGGMIPKVECCVTAVENGVESAHILDGRVPHSMLIEILSDEGIGTVIKA